MVSAFKSCNSLVRYLLISVVLASMASLLVSHPKQSSLYQKLADAFQCRVSYPMNDDETVCVGNDEPSEYSGAKQARQILEQAAALFASGTMTNEDKTIFMDGMTRLYLESKKNRRKW